MSLLQFLNNGYFAGKVGIGTAGPDAKLHVESTTATGANFILETTHTGGIPLLDLKGAHSAQLRYKDELNVIQGRVDFGDSGTFNFIDVPNNKSTLYLKTGGNVGIGTTSPNGKLSFENAVETRKIVLYEGANNDYQFYGFGIESSTLVYSTASVDDDHVFFSGASATTRNELMRIEGGGNVGIGTTSNDASSPKLQVAGSIMSSSSSIIAAPTTASIVIDYHSASNAGRIMTGSGAAWNKNLALVPYGGNVGIGTTSPTGGALVVDITAAPANADISAQATGTIAFSDNGTNEPAIIGKSTADNTNGLYIVAAASDTNSDADFQLNVREDNNSDFSTLTTRAFDFTRWSTSLMTILRNGNVGIGATSPTEKLDISGTAIVRSTLFTVGNVHGFTSSYGASFFINNSGGTSYFNATGGNVGINTTTPGEKLEVAGNIKITAALLSNQDNTDVDTGTETVANVAIATYTAAFFDFVIKKTTNVRSGTVYACHDGTNVEFTETSTNDLGDTSDVTLSVDISGTNMRLLATVTSDDWSVKSLIRAI